MAWLGRLWNVLRPDRLQRDLDRELSFHLLEKIDELQAGGMSRDEARRAARVQLGNYTLQRERTRDMDINEWLQTTLRNLRQAARALAKAPGFTATVAATLALGIGANSAVFSAIYAVILKPLPFPNSDRLVTLEQFNAKAHQPFVAPVRLADWDRLNTTFQAMTGWYSQDESELSGELPERLTRAFVARRFLEVWGMAPELGRDFSPAEEHSGASPVVLISDRYWRRHFNADPNVVGKRLRFSGSFATIVGVMPASFLFPQRQVDLWSPGWDDAPFARNRNLTWYTCAGRMKPGVTVAQAQANLNAVQAALGRQFPKPDAEISPVVKSLKDSTIAGVRNSLWILFGSVSLLLLIACTNVAALLLSRGASRQMEISVRFSLGASRRAVIANLLSEVLILAIVGAGLGLLLAAAAASVFHSLARNLPRVEEISLNWDVVMYSLACALLVTMLCGLLPAMRGTRGNIRVSRTSVSSGNRLRFTLVGMQVALAVTLLAGAALLIRSLEQLGRVSPGFDPEHILTFQLSSSWAETGDPKRNRQRANRILDGLRATPGVEDAALALNLPGVPSEFQVQLKLLEGRGETEPKILAQGRSVSTGYFAAMKIPLVAGEMCREESNVSTAMVNRSFANAYFEGSSPLGRHLSLPGNLYVPTSEVRGIVGDAREMGLDREPVPTVYWCGSFMQPGTHFLVRTHGDAARMPETIRRAMHAIEPARSVFDMKPLTDQISDAFAENRLRTILLAFFGAAAILLASVGVYGTINYSVHLRRREVGLRLALGAMRTRIVRQFLSQGLVVAVLGCMAGLAGALALSRLLAGMLFGVSATDPLTLASVVVLVVAVSIAASILPAVRAARLEPMQVLREE